MLKCKLLAHASLLSSAGSRRRPINNAPATGPLPVELSTGHADTSIGPSGSTTIPPTPLSLPSRAMRLSGTSCSMSSLSAAVCSLESKSNSRA